MIDLTYLKNTTGDDKEVMADLFQLFLSQLPAQEKAIADAFSNKDYHVLREMAHKAKNSFQIIGSNNQAENLKKIELLAIAKKPVTEIEPLVADFIQACKDIKVEIEKLEL